MKYLCLIYVSEATLAATAETEVAAVTDACIRHCEELEKNGQLLAAEELQPVNTAVTIRMVNGKPSVTDGPFAETREQLGGFYLIDARDLNDAIRIAEKIPPAKYGCIEVRPIMQ